MRQGSWFNFTHNVLNKTKGKIHSLERVNYRERLRESYIQREKEIQINGIIIKQGLQVNFYTREREKKSERERERIREREKENQLKKTKKKKNTRKRERERENQSERERKKFTLIALS